MAPTSCGRALNWPRLAAQYARIASEPSRPLNLYTALSLDPPAPAAGGGWESQLAHEALALLQQIRPSAGPPPDAEDVFSLTKGILDLNRLIAAAQAEAGQACF